MKKLLIITGCPHDKAIRIKKFQQYLPEYGWETVILAKQKPRWLKYPVIHPKYTTFSIIEPPKGRGKLNRAFQYAFLEDSTIIWAATSKRKTQKIIEKEKPDAIMISCPPFSVAFLGALIKKKNPQTPLIIDYRDPWSFNVSRGRETKIHRKVTLLEEKWTDKAADHIIQVAETYRKKYLKEYPQTPPEKVSVIPNGYDPEDYKNIKPKEYNKFTISQIGTITEQTDTQYLETYKTICHQNRMFAKETQLLIAGRIFPPKKEEIQKLSKKCPIKILGLIPRQEALSIETGSHVLIYSGIKEMGKTDLTSRIYGHIYAGAYTIAITNPRSEIEHIINTTKAGKAIPYENQEELTKTLLDLWKKWRNGENINTNKNKNKMHQYNHRNTTKQLAQILNKETQKYNYEQDS